MGFSSEWLALREPADHAARDSALLKQITDYVGTQATVLDLGSGTGSTARAFQGAATANWQWRFLDSDSALLEEAKARQAGAQAHVMNLQNINDLPLEGVSLVTASALLDLMPQDWIAALAQRLSAAKIPFYAALNYNGDMHWSQPLSEDVRILNAFNKHQNTDKGIGNATGAQSAHVTESLFKQQGYRVHLANSPWVLGPEQTALQRELLAGIAQAADEIGVENANIWLSDRLAKITISQTVIGHTDVLALPATDV